MTERYQHVPPMGGGVAEMELEEHAPAREAEVTRLSSGVPGLDEVLHGGFIANRVYLVRGTPGTGKTTLAMQFLVAGAAAGEKALFISLKDPTEQVQHKAKALGLDMNRVAILDLSPSPDLLAQKAAYELFTPAEMQRAPQTQRITAEVDRLKPARVVLDGVAQFRYLSDPQRFRAQMLALFRYLTTQGATVLAVSEADETHPDTDLQFMGDGTINLEFAPGGRTLAVFKYADSGFEEGRHSLKLTDRGMVVYPRLIPAVYRREFAAETVPSGVPALDELLHGGLERGTVTIITGPTGVGKTTLGLQFMKEAAGRGERSVVYTFEEPPELIARRAEGINIPVAAMMERGTLLLQRVEPLRYSPDEFANLVRREVEQENARIVMIDSMAGYRLAIQMRGEDLAANIHALLQYLGNMGVTAILTNEVEAITGEFRATEVGVSYLADNIIFLRYIEVAGELRRAIGVLKKRLSDFEKTLREVEITRYGLKVGRPLTELRGILSGMPELVRPATVRAEEKAI